jgi:hypothetical protein
MTTIYQESQSGGYSLKSILSKTQDSTMTSKYGHLSVPLGLLCQVPSLDTKEEQKISYQDEASIVSDKLFDTLFQKSNVDSERKKSGRGKYTRKKRNKKTIVSKNTKKNKSKLR